MKGLFAGLVLLVFLVALLPQGVSAQSDPVKGCVQGTATQAPVLAKVVYVIPTFTLSPYYHYHTSFYAFYLKHENDTSPTKSDLSMLKVEVSRNWSSPEFNEEKPLYDFLHSEVAARCGLVAGRDLSFVDDPALDSGALFTGSTRNYDVVILGHEEYVTANEFSQLEQFVSSGGRVVAMSGNTFWAKVNYSSSTNVETFVAGHGFQFNGTAAWKSSVEPFDAAAADWFGSSFAYAEPPLYGALLQRDSTLGSQLIGAYGKATAFIDYSYPHNEANYVSNMTETQVVARFYIGTNLFSNGMVVPVFPAQPIDAYVHWFREGEVVGFGVFGPNIIMIDGGAQYFLVRAVSDGFRTASGYLPPTCGVTSRICS